MKNYLFYFQAPLLWIGFGVRSQILLFILTSHLAAFAQRFPAELESLQWKNDANGKPLFSRNYLNSEGSPDFSTEYCTATLTTNDKTYSGVKVKLNLLDNQVLFMDDNTEKIASIPVNKIEFTSCPNLKTPVVFRSGYAAIDEQKQSTFYQVLDSGKAGLLKYYKITYRDERPYNSAVTTRIFNREEFYYASKPDKTISKLKKSSEDVVNVLADKKALVQAFIDQNKLKCKKEEDLVKVFNYYNSIQ